jgi:hypothetical protein
LEDRKEEWNLKFNECKRGMDSFGWRTQMESSSWILKEEMRIGDLSFEKGKEE